MVKNKKGWELEETEYRGREALRQAWLVSGRFATSRFAPVKPSESAYQKVSFRELVETNPIQEVSTRREEY